MVGALHLNLFMKSVIQTNLRRFSMFRHFVDVNSIPEMKDEHECRHHVDAGTLVPLNNVRVEVSQVKKVKVRFIGTWVRVRKVYMGRDCGTVANTRAINFFIEQLLPVNSVEQIKFNQPNGRPVVTYGAIK